MSLSTNDAAVAKRTAPSVLKWRIAFALAFVALFSGLLLTGVSVWFLGAVALAGVGPAAFTFNFHTPAALVRLFALTRTVAKYGERVVGHHAALLDQVSRRATLFAAMATGPGVRAAGWQFGDQDRLSDFMDDVEDVDYARLRVGLPVGTLAAGFGALVLATLLVAPLALLPIAAMLAFNAWLVRRLLPRARQHGHSIRSLRRGAARRLGVALAAVVPLQAERAWRAMLDVAFARLAAADNGTLRFRREQAWIDCAAGLAGPLAAVSVLMAGWMGGHRGEALLPPAFLAFAWLALGETMQGVSRILAARVREEAARQGIRLWAADTPSAGDRPAAKPRGPAELQLSGIPLCAPDGRRIGGQVNLVLRRGLPTALTGPSGSGKTSLLKQIAGWVVADEGGRMLGDGVSLAAAARRRLIHFGLHDAAILADTVRENLFTPEAGDAECWAALEAMELDGRVRAAGGLEGWIMQDMLSLGEAQRLNLARAMLSRSPVILLDEPTEHLDAEQARRMMARLVTHFGDRILLFSSHERDVSWLEKRAHVVSLEMLA